LDLFDLDSYCSKHQPKGEVGVLVWK
jgi:hypothetical protein